VVSSRGPSRTEEIRSRLASRTLTPDALVYAHGVTAEWTPAGQIPALAEGPTAPPPPVPAPGGGMQAHEVDYQVGGDDLQYVVVELDPQETVVAEAGAMMYMEDGIEMETRFGDGSKPDKGFFGKLVEGAKRKMTGETLFLTHYTHQGQGKSHVAFGAPYPGKIIPVDLREVGGTLLCQKDAFLCCAKGIELGIAFQKRLGVGFFGGEGFIMQKLTGDGMAFMHAGGTVIEKDLAAGRAAAHRHRLHRGLPGGRRVRDQVRRRGEDGALRRRGPVLREADRARQGSGCRRCRSRGWPTGSIRPRRRPAGAGRARARCWAASGISSTGTTEAPG
jgi:uncharacterized protein (AIM24 family)